MRADAVAGERMAMRMPRGRRRRASRGRRVRVRLRPARRCGGLLCRLRRRGGFDLPVRGSGRLACSPGRFSAPAASAAALRSSGLSPFCTIVCTAANCGCSSWLPKFFALPARPLNSATRTSGGVFSSVATASSAGCTCGAFDPRQHARHFLRHLRPRVGRRVEQHLLGGGRCRARSRPWPWRSSRAAASARSAYSVATSASSGAPPALLRAASISFVSAAPVSASVKVTSLAAEVLPLDRRAALRRGRRPSTARSSRGVSVASWSTRATSSSLTSP